MNIITYLKAQIRRLRDEQIETLMRIIEGEYKRRELRDDIGKISKGSK